MATTYEVGLKWAGHAAAQQAKADLDAVRKAGDGLEAQRFKANKGGTGAGNDWAKQWKAAERAQAKILSDEQKFSAYRIRLDRKEAAEKARTQEKSIADSLKAEQQRNREEERFSAYRIRLMRKESAEKIRETARANAAAEKAYNRSLTGRFAKGLSNKAYNAPSAAAGALLSAPGAMLSGALGAVGSMVSSSAEMVYNFAKMTISAQAMREQSVEAFNAVFKSATAGDKLFDSARRAAKQTKLDTPDVVKRFTTLGSRGFGEQEIEKTFWSIADIETARGYATANRYENALSKLKVSPRATMATFTQGAMASGGTELAEQKLADIIGIKDRKDLDTKIREMFKKGKISGSSALDALVAGSTSRYDPSGHAGEFAKTQGEKSWGGMLSNIANGLSDVLNSAEVANSGPLGEFKKTLMSIGEIFEDNSERGIHFKAIIKSMVDSTFSIFDGMSDKSGDTMDTLLHLGDMVASKYKELMTYIRDNIRPAFEKALKDPSGTLTEAFTKIGTIVGAAIVKGMYEGVGAVTGLGRYSDITTDPDTGKQRTTGKAWYNAAEDLTSWMVGMGGSESSKVPSMASGGIVPGPAGSPRMILAHGQEVIPGMGGEYIGAAIAKYGGGHGGGVSVQISMPVTTSNDPAELAAKAGPMIAAQVEVQLQRVLGRWQAQGA